MNARIEIPEAQRIGEAMRRFGCFVNIIEERVYSTLYEICNGYRLSPWRMYDIGAGGVYLAPDCAPLRLVMPCGFVGTLTGDACGIVACLQVYQDSAERYGSDRFRELHRALSWFSATHTEAPAIQAASRPC